MAISEVVRARARRHEVAEGSLYDRRDEKRVQIGFCSDFVTGSLPQPAEQDEHTIFFFRKQWICIGSICDGCLTFSNTTCGWSSGYPSVPVAAFPWLRISSTLRRSSEGRKGFSRMFALYLIGSRNSGKS